jgi:hypothetical protein
MATFATPCVSACMLLLAPELLSITLCAGSVGSELGPINSMDGHNIDKLAGSVRVSAAL